MAHPQKSSARPDATNANYLSIWFANHWPDNELEVTSFLLGAAHALGGREADLARYMGVSRATLSSWKMRGAIPEAHKAWFFDEFPCAVLSNAAPMPGEDLRHAGLPAVLHLLRTTAFNPFGLPPGDDFDTMNVLYRQFLGLARLALFIQHHLRFDEYVGKDPEVVAAEVLRGFLKVVSPRIFGARKVSQ